MKHDYITGRQWIKRGDAFYTLQLSGEQEAA